MTTDSARTPLAAALLVALASPSAALAQDAAATADAPPAGFSSDIVAGGTKGDLDGVGVRSQFNYPENLALDAEGNVFVSDTQNSTLRKVDPDGQVTTIAGKAGVSGVTDGPAASAELTFPRGIDVGEDGTVYFADTVAHTIRKLSPEGNVTVIAGGPGDGSGDGPAREAKFKEPHGLALHAGELFVADKSNEAIRVVTAGDAPNVITFVGGRAGFEDGTGNDARLDSPIGVSAGEDGTLLVADYANQAIRKVEPNGKVTTLVSEIGGLVSDAEYGADGRLYVAVPGANDIYVYGGTSGQLLAKMSSFDVNLIEPTDIEVAGDGTLLVANKGGHSIIRVTVQD